ncbi:hypothetical protein KKB83_03600 [Patescibacteria group bacterium]|nr:hypothetical protein [Patescibacteria group bacterium]
MKTFFSFKQPSILFPVVCTIVSFGVVMFAIYPWVRESYQMKAEIVEKEILLERKLMPKAELLGTLSEAVLDTSILILEEALPSFAHEWTAFAALESLARNSQVELGTLSVAVSSAEGLGNQGGGAVLQVPVIVDGDASQIVAFLKNTERAKRVLSLNNLEIESDEDKLHVSADVLFPYLPLPKSFGAVEEALIGLGTADEEILAQVSKLNSYGTFIQSTIGEVGESEIGSGKEDPF